MDQTLIKKTPPSELDHRPNNNAISPISGSIWHGTHEFNSPSDPDRQAKTIKAVQPFINLKDFREKAIVGLEKQNLKDLISQTVGNPKEALAISGPGRFRFYQLLKSMIYPIGDL